MIRGARQIEELILKTRKQATPFHIHVSPKIKRKRKIRRPRSLLIPVNLAVREKERQLIQRAQEILQANPRRNLTDVVRLVGFIEVLFPSMLQAWLDYRRDCWRPEFGGLRDVRVEGYDLFIAATQTLKMAKLGPPLPTDKECWRWLRSQGYGPFASFGTVSREAKRLIKSLDVANATPINERTPDQYQLLGRYPLAVFHLTKLPNL